MAGIQTVFEELKRKDVLGGLGTEPVKLVRRGEVRILKDELKLGFHLLYTFIITVVQLRML